MKILKLACALSLVSVLAACGTPDTGNTDTGNTNTGNGGNTDTGNPDTGNGGNTDTGNTVTPQGLGFSKLTDGNGGWNIEPHEYSSNTAPNYNRAASVKAFEETLYKHLRDAGCAGCHNSSGAGQAPLHADDDVGVAHDYAITRTNFADPARSRLVVRQRIERHGCVVQGDSNACAKAADKMQTAVEAFVDKVANMYPTTPRPVPAGEQITESDIKQWIADDKAKLSADEKEFSVYTSLHLVHNEGVQDHKNNKPLSAEDLNIFRAGLSKALNSVARWAPEIKNPIDVNGKGILYRFDIRWYWGFNKGGIDKLLFGGSDDDLFFGQGKKDYKGNSVSSAVLRQTYGYTDNPSAQVKEDDKLAKIIWDRVLHGNIEGASTRGNLGSFIDGFHGQKAAGAVDEYMPMENLEYVEVPQLVYTLTRPDVYNAIMMIPMQGHQLERELGVEKKSGNGGLDTYKWVSSWEAITIDSRLLAYAKTNKNRSYWKSFDIFSGQIAEGNISIYDVYDAYPDSIRFPWWANPIPKYIAASAVGTAKVSDYSFIASLAQPNGTQPAGCDGQPSLSGIQGFWNCRHYTGTGGLQQAATEIIFEMPNGLQGYMLTGAENQRRVDAFINIVRDPRIITDATDEIGHYIDFEYQRAGGRRGNANDPRLNNGSSCIGCHVNGMNRIGNDSGDWARMEKERPGSSPWPRGKYGIDAWKNDGQTLDKVIELYPPSSEVHATNEKNREVFLTAVTETKDIMLGEFKNTPVEPIITVVEYAQKYYNYPQTTSN